MPVSHNQMLRWDLLTPGDKGNQHLKQLSLLPSFHFNAKMNCISTSPRLQTTCLQAETEEHRSKRRGTPKRIFRAENRNGRTHLRVLWQADGAQHVHKQACGIEAMQLLAHKKSCTIWWWSSISPGCQPAGLPSQLISEAIKSPGPLYLPTYTSAKFCDPADFLLCKDSPGSHVVV